MPVSSATGMNSAGGDLAEGRAVPAQERLDRRDLAGLAARTRVGTRARARRAAPRRAARGRAPAGAPRGRGRLPRRTTIRSPPARLASYIALSARRIASRASVRVPPISAIPMLAVRTVDSIAGQRLRDRVEQPEAELGRFLLAAHLLGDHDELVAAKATDEVACSGRRSRGADRPRGSSRRRGRVRACR